MSPVKQHDSRGGYRLRFLCNAFCLQALCVHRIYRGRLDNAFCGGCRQFCVPRFVAKDLCAYHLASGPLNNMTPTVPTDALCLQRLLCSPHCPCIAFPVALSMTSFIAVAMSCHLCAETCMGTTLCVYRIACRSLNYMIRPAATGHLSSTLPCVGTAFSVYRLTWGPRNNIAAPVAIDRPLCAPPCVCAAKPRTPTVTQFGQP